MVPAAYVVSSESSKLVPVPVDQVDPASKLYCQVAPASRPPTFIVASFVMPSAPELPVSAARARLGVATVMSVVIAAALLPALLRLPATSVWRT